MRSNQDGFSAIELLIVMVTMGVVSAIAIPNLESSRNSANSVVAVELTRDLHVAQISYQAGVGNGSFGSAPPLFEAGLIGAELAGGRANGYDYGLTVSTDGQHFEVDACPAALKRSGSTCFHTDDTLPPDVVVVVCPPGLHLDPGTGLCVSDDSFFAFSVKQFIRAVNQATGGVLLPAVQALAHAVPTLAQQLMMTVMDTNHDNLLTFDEALNANMLGAGLNPLLPPTLDAFRRDLALGVAGEQIAPVPIPTMVGDLAAFFDSIPPPAPPGARSK